MGKDSENSVKKKEKKKRRKYTVSRDESQERVVWKSESNGRERGEEDRYKEEDLR